MNNSIAIVRNCQSNFLRKVANNGTKLSTDQQIMYQNDLQELEKSEKAKQLLKNTLVNVARDNKISSTPAEQQPELFRRYLFREKVKAYAPWMIGSTVVGGGIGGLIGSKYNRTLLGALLGGAGGLALGGIGKGLYERYVNDDRFGKVQRGMDAINGLLEAGKL